MVPFVLPNVLLIAEECTKDEYIRLILPDLRPVFKQQEPIQVDAQRQSWFLIKRYHYGCLGMFSFSHHFNCMLPLLGMTLYYLLYFPFHAFSG